MRLWRLLPWICLNRMRVTMTMRDAGRGKRIDRKHYSVATTRIEWVSIEKDESGSPLVRRTPKPNGRIYFTRRGFFAAGKHYANWQELIAEHDDYYEHCRDRYGREVVYDWERFPCFDSYDYIHEDRCRRWFLLRKGDKLTYIYLEDQTNYVQVIEDVLDVENRCWDKLVESGLMSDE